MNFVRYADRPDLRARRHAELSGITFPDHMHHNEPGNRYWGRLYSDFPEFQVALVEGDELLAEAHAVPVPWDGTLDDLPSGWEEGFVLGMTSERPATALMAIAISVAPARQGERLSGRMIETFKENARAAGLSTVIAPVRPTLKERYPLIPIERYIEWRREDGSHFDPWIRVHEIVGGEIRWRGRGERRTRRPAGSASPGVDDDHSARCATARGRTSSRTSGCSTASASRTLLAG